MQNISNDISTSVKSIATSFLDEDESSQLGKLINALEKVYIFRAIGIDPDLSDEESANKLMRIVIPLESELHYFQKDNETDVLHGYSLIASIFEYAARVKVKDPVQSKQFWLRASLAYLQAEKSANSIVCAKNARNISNNSGDVVDESLHMVSDFLSHNLNTLVNEAPALLDKLKQKLTEDMDSIQKQSFFLGLIEFVQSVFSVSKFLKDGPDQVVNNWSIHMNLALAHFQKSGDDIFVWLSSRMAKSMLHLVNNALWNLTHLIPKEIIKAFTQHKEFPIYDLWNNQIEALEKITGPKSRKHYSLVMPTSAGKTLVAALVIAKELLKHKGNCFYSTPYKALVSEVAEFMDRYLPTLGINVSYLPGKYDSIPELDTLVGNSARLYVLTPEKLDLLWRTNDPRVKDTSVFVFDEIQNIVQEGRGLRLELLVSRIKERFGIYSRIILLSAVIPESNLIKLVEWLGSKLSDGSNISWTPTRTLEAVYWRAKMQDFRGDLHYIDRFNIVGILPTNKFATRRNDAAELALKYQKQLGPVLVYCSSRDEAEKTAELILEKSSNLANNPMLESQAEYVESILGSDVQLPGMIRKGIAYHHASLPDSVKKTIERLGSNGVLKIITCTSTLAEGVNLNVGTVIISNTFQGQISMDGLKLRNLAGRAGRALKDTEGHVVLMEPAARQALTDDAYSKFESRFFQYLSSISDNPSFDSDVDAVESDLLARFYKKSISRDSIDKDTKEILKSTLFARQSNAHQFNSVLSSLQDQAQKIISIPDLRDAQLKVFAETGLGIRHCQHLDSQAKNFAAGPKLIFRDEYDKIDWAQIRGLVDHCLLPSSRYGARIQSVVSDPVTIIEEWLAGSTLLQIASKAEEQPSSNTLRIITQFLYGYVSDEVSWANAALLKLIDDNISSDSKFNLDYELYLLPSYLKYGVNTPGALFICLSGLEDRDLANKISKTCPLIRNSKLDWPKVINWILSINDPKLSEVQKHVIHNLSSFTLPLFDFSGKSGSCKIAQNGFVIQDEKTVSRIGQEYIHLLKVLSVRDSTIRLFRDSVGNTFLEVNLS